MITFYTLLLYFFPVMVVALVCSNIARRPHYLKAGALKSTNHLLTRRCLKEGGFPMDEDDLETYGSLKKNEEVHLIVLVHGILGNPSELESLKDFLLSRGEEKRSDRKKLFKRRERVVVHSAACNDGLTHDGIEAGGTRLANEINNLVKELWNRNSPRVRLSLVGNSLGGLYARYALSEIQWRDRRTKLIPHYFVTTATPHLGCGYQQTYLPLPRFIEAPIATALRQTGKDLFRFNNVIAEMTFGKKFLSPLSSFDQRIAYINVHGTDFQVPTPTAGFWADTDSVHHVIEEYTTVSRSNSFDSEESSTGDNERPRNIVMKLRTPTKGKRREKRDEDLDDDEQILKLELLTNSETKEEEMTGGKDAAAPASLLSLKLDQLGWTKVLVDVREKMPINLNKQQNQADQEENQNDTSQKTEWTSRELLREFDTGRLKSFPIGHTVMVANAKNEFYKKLNKGGMPIMDDLAKILINST